MIGGRIRIETHIFPWLPLINNYEYQQPLQCPTAQTLALPKGPASRLWAPNPCPSGWMKTQSDAASPPYSTNGKAVANIPGIFLAIQFSGTLWFGGDSARAGRAG